MGLRGYLRPDWHIGIRNYIAIVFVGTASRYVAEKIAVRVPGAEVFGFDILNDCLAVDKLSAAAMHPNVSAVMVVGSGLEGEVLDTLVQQVAINGKPVAQLRILAEGGTTRAIQKGVKEGLLLSQQAQQTQLISVALADLIIGVVSDSETGEVLNPAVIWAMGRIVARKGTVLFAVKPSAASLADAQMIAAGHRPTAPGVYWIDSPGSAGPKAAFSLLLQSGAHIIVEVTHKGSTSGSVVVPVMKIAAETAVYDKLSDDLDINAGYATNNIEAVFEIGQAILEKLMDTASGAPTQAEVLGHKEFWG